jgi:hypothetical protein
MGHEPLPIQSEIESAGVPLFDPHGSHQSQSAPMMPPSLSYVAQPSVIQATASSWDPRAIDPLLRTHSSSELAGALTLPPITPSNGNYYRERVSDVNTVPHPSASDSTTPIPPQSHSHTPHGEPTSEPRPSQEPANNSTSTRTCSVRGCSRFLPGPLFSTASTPLS